MRAARAEEEARKVALPASECPTSLQTSSDLCSLGAASASAFSSASHEGCGAVSSSSLSSSGGAPALICRNLGAAPTVLANALRPLDLLPIDFPEGPSAMSDALELSVGIHSSLPAEVEYDSLQAIQKDLEELESFSLSALVPEQSVEPFDDLLV